jgi:hypothetical protein
VADLKDYPYEIDKWDNKTIKEHIGDRWGGQRGIPYGWEIVSVEGRKVMAKPITYNVSKEQNYSGWSGKKAGLVDRLVEFEKYKSNSNRVRLVNPKDKPFNGQYFRGDDSFIKQVEAKLNTLVIVAMNENPDLRYDPDGDVKIVKIAIEKLIEQLKA